MACDLIIPTFNHPDLLRDLLKNLEKNTNKALLGKIWIGDDASDAFSKEAFRELVQGSSLPIELIHRPQNRGFGANCNDLFARSTATHCIILNTDILLPPKWLERMLAPFLQDSSIALATPLSTNAAEHTVELKPGQDWMSVDGEYEKRQPHFPDSCTAIGFCLGVDRKKLADGGIELFDRTFGRGYGEDTDLHYRVTEKNFRSVVVDNLVVHHIGGSSFSFLPEYQDLRAHAQTVFFEKWSKQYVKMQKRELRRRWMQKVRRKFSARPSAASRDLDVLIVLPNTLQRYGGVRLACALMASMIASGKRVGMLVTEEHTAPHTRAFGFEPFQSKQEVLQAVSSVGCVLATGNTTMEMAHELAQAFTCSDALLLQGMEISFRAGRNVRTFRAYQQAKHVIAVSEALEEYMALINPKADIAQISAGPDPLLFYPRHVPRAARSIAIALNATPEKGATQALEIGLLLKERGFTLSFFGYDAASFDIPADLGITVERTDPDALAELFSRTEFLIDQSFAEGLGLIPLEAAFCGCIPVRRPRGGGEYIFTDGETCIELRGYKYLREDIDILTGMTQEDCERMRKNMLQLRMKYRLQESLKKAENALMQITTQH